MGRKLKFILSDLHLGAGQPDTACNPLEDFAATEDFVAFLREIVQESEQDHRDVELIFNGDLFEFLQVPAVDKYDPTFTYPREVYLDSSEAASIKRLKIILQGHREVFNALCDFMHVESPQRRVTIIKGNHDICLFWPKVKSYLREVLGASGVRASLLRFADAFVSREHIYVEHGHQWAEKMNGYQDSFDPRSTADPSQLFYPAGSCFVIDFLNQVEPKLAFVDQIKPLTTLIWYALAWDFDFASQALIVFIRHAIAKGPEATEKMIAPAETFLHDLEDERKRRVLAEKYKNDPAFRLEFHQQIHQYLNEFTVANQGANDYPNLKISDNAMEIGRANQQRQRAMLRRAAEEITDREKAKVILFGHTHEAVQEVLPSDCLYINTGCWIKDFSHTPPQTWQALFNGAIDDHQIPHRLPYARIDYDQHGNPQAQLLYFNSQPNSESSPTSSNNNNVESRSFFKKSVQRFFRILGVEKLEIRN